jgi:arylsulfatase A-like enzyme
VIVLVDAMRADHVGCYGYTRATSPAIDALAADATRF